MKHIAVVSVMLVGCDTTPQVIEKPVYVDVPVVVSCVRSVPEEPVYDTARLKADDDLDTVGTAYMVEQEQRKIYTRQLQSVLAGCVAN